MKSIRLPLHLDPHDTSPDAAMRRLEFRADMGALNPSGFRKFQTTRIGSRKPKKARVDRLAAVCEEVSAR